METYQDLEMQAILEKKKNGDLCAITLYMDKETMLLFEQALRDFGVKFIDNEKLNSGTTDCNTEN